ncbi:MAG: putative imidazole glycerol phosphate synthase subunit HisH [Actinomycetota bacterium]
MVILDYGSGNVRSAQRAVETTGATVSISSDFDEAMNCDALLVPGVGAFASCMAGLKNVRGDQIIGRRLAGSRPVLGICVGMQVLFEKSTEHAETGFHAGLNEWPGTVDQLTAPVLPHMGWNNVSCAPQSQMFTGIEDERFYFVHSYAARNWELDPHEKLAAPKVSWSNHGENFVAAVENGPLWATQFHPEKSGDAGLTLLANWIAAIK